AIRNCYVHHVNGKVGGKKTGGIYVEVRGEQVKTKFHNLLIENNRIAHTGGVGISNQSSWGNIKSDDYHPWTNFVIRGNRVEHTGRNGIIMRYALNPIVEYNVLAYNSRFDTGHSVFNFNTVGCVVQYNEAYGNTSDNPDDIDHGGFDADYNSRGTIIQYNYSHDNNWFCGIMKRPVNTDITIRYNISQNELLGAFLYGFPKETGVKDVKIYNNTIYFGKGKGTRVFVAAGKTRIPTETAFYNNIFCFEEKAEWGFEPDETCVFENNLFVNVGPKGEAAINKNPQFVNPGSGKTDIDMKDPNRLSGYRLKEGSPAIQTGKELENNGGKDFSGRQISGIPNIGAL
ncbi:right-handed parallel beta-helix repeat-containing protein, partial [Draconibacterium sp.]|uniref:right-handed parallel beta-helix repeat-containing protein n=1 Tax=Draconibacterium sp. TaxID=1965318 RepID=UPI0035619AAC